MSDLFDPSKLNVDFGDLKGEKEKDLKIKKAEEKKKELKKKEEINLQEADVPNDILKSINLNTKNGKSKEKKEDTVKVDDGEKGTGKKNTGKKDNGEKKSEDQEKDIIMDINLSSIEALINLIDDNKYDFLIIEPDENNVKILLHKDSKVIDTKYIRYHIYSKILINIKNVTNLDIEEINKEQEGKGIFDSKDKRFNIITKTVPSAYGEKVFLKATGILNEKKEAKKEKASLGKVLGVLASAAFVSLILGGTFITFVVLNAKTIDDVRFFYSLGINLNDINAFIAKIVVIIFSILLFIETTFTAIFLFKSFLTKKKFKKQKVFYTMIAIVALIITTVTGGIWMMIDKKIRDLPNWEEIAQGNIQLYDNDKLTSKFFDQKGSIIEDTSELIGPITIKYDLSLFEKREAQKSLVIKKYIWNFGGEEIEGLTSTLIKEFDKKGNYEVTLMVEEEGLNGKVIKKEVENISSVIISSIVDIEEKSTTNGGKTIHFDASELEKLGRVEWYMKEDLENPVWENYLFEPAKIFFEENVILLKIKRAGKDNDNFDKIFVIKGIMSNSIKGRIVYTQSTEDDLTYDIQIKNPETNFGEGFIEEFEWIFGNKRIVNKANPIDLEESSKTSFKFTSYGENKVSVIIRDSSGQYREVKTIINIPRKIDLTNSMIISEDNKEIADLKYLRNNNEYFINGLGVPTNLKFDGKFLKAFDERYTLDGISWDFNNDGSVDEVGKTIKHDIIIEGNHTIIATYKFVNRKNVEDILYVKESIYIEGIKKDAILNLNIEKESDYAPMNVRFDASKSYIKDDDIVKFIYDYGDGIVEERDAINPGHKYSTAGNYVVKLTVFSKTGKEYSISKDLILKPKPQKAKIGVSMKEAPIGQGISFFSSDSQGQIIGYFWDFGDGNISTEANPTHSYEKTGKYKISLKLNFANNNSLIDESEIEIYYGE